MRRNAVASGWAQMVRMAAWTNLDAPVRDACEGVPQSSPRAVTDDFSPSANVDTVDVALEPLDRISR